MILVPGFRGTKGQSLGLYIYIGIIVPKEVKGYLPYYRRYRISDEALQDVDRRFGHLCTGLDIGACINRNRVRGTRAILIKDYKEIMLLVAPTSELTIAAPVAAQQINEAKLCFVGDVSPHLPRHLYTVHSCASDTPPIEKR